MTPDEAMRHALVRAHRASGRTFPNPAVGAIVFRGDRILAGGATQPPGGPHAEVVALRAAIRKHGKNAVRGASMAVTLEPCCFTGRTGPCTEAILDAKIRKVVIGCRDPHARVRGRGIRKLRSANVEVVVGVREGPCREHHRGFFSLCQRGRPFVTLKLATSLDARIATAGGESRWITGSEARRFVHRLRASSDAVMVGSGTALADDPDLSARRGDRLIRRPIRLLVDSRLRLAPSARLYSGLLPETEGGQPEAQTWVLCRKGARGARAIRATGAKLIEIPVVGPHIDLSAGLQALGSEGLTSVLVEGGGRLAASLLRAELVDAIHWIQAPILLGGDGIPALGSLGIDRLSEAVYLNEIARRKLGRDLHIHAIPNSTSQSLSKAVGNDRKRPKGERGAAR